MDEWQSYLVSFDTDRIKQFLFVTNRLKEIRGGSAILDNLDGERERMLKQRYGGDNVVYSAGGGAAVLVSEEDDAIKLIAKIEREFRQQTITASITGAYLKPEPANGRKFGERMEKASERLRQVKADKAELASLPVEPYMHLCDSCGYHPADTCSSDGSGDLLCLSCAKKRDLGGDKRKGFFKEFSDYVTQRAGSTTWEGTMPDDLDNIGAVSSPPNYVGFIALDGNQIGDLLSKPATMETYWGFSRGLGKLTEEQVFEALERFGQPRNEVSPFEIVLIGGDDVLLITAADIAIEVALTIATGFEQHSLAKVLKPGGLANERKRLTMAAGVVLAHADFPIPAMHQLAEVLQKSAKKLCASKKYETGAVDFLVVSGSDVDLDEMRRSIPHRRPYVLEDMQKLLQYIRQFKEAGFPTSQLQAMYQALFDGRVNAELASIATLGYLGRREDKTLYTMLKEFFKGFGVAFDGQLPPWEAKEAGDGNGRLTTALADLVELYPFVNSRGG